MSGIFNASIFSNSVFNTGVVSPVIVIIGGGAPLWKNEAEAKVRRPLVEKWLARKRNQEAQLKQNIKKLEKKAKTDPEPDAFLLRIEENHRKLLQVREEITELQWEFSAIDDYLDRIISSWSEEEEDEDDWMLLQ